MERANQPVNSIVIPKKYGAETGAIVEQDIHIGLTKREYFAGLAMQGFAANDVIGRNFNSKEAAERSIAWANELLRQLEK